MRRPWHARCARAPRRLYRRTNGLTRAPHRARFRRHEAPEAHGSRTSSCTSNPQAVFIDCRSEMEYFFVGHPVGAHHVAWNDGPDWEINPHFVGQVKKVASMNRPIVLICRSGHRSIDAGLALEKAGFTEVYNVLEASKARSTTSTTAARSRRLAQGRPALGAAVTQRRSELRGTVVGMLINAAPCRPRPAADCRSTARIRGSPSLRVEPARGGHPVERVELELAVADRARLVDQRLGEPPPPAAAAMRRLHVEPLHLADARRTALPTRRQPRSTSSGRSAMQPNAAPGSPASSSRPARRRVGARQRRRAPGRSPGSTDRRRAMPRTRRTARARARCRSRRLRRHSAQSARASSPFAAANPRLMPLTGFSQRRS